MDLIDKIESVAKEIGLDSSAIGEICDIVFNDSRPKLKHAYLFANTWDNESSLFEAAIQMQQQSLAKKFLIVNGLDANGFPGYEKWSYKLGRLVGSSNISPVPIENQSGVNTYSESAALADYTKKQKINGIYVIAAQFHQLRAFMTAASEAIKSNPRLNIFSYPGCELPWNEMVLHSQGKLRGRRADFILAELERIKQYSNILPPAQILNYLQNRKIPKEN